MSKRVLFIYSSPVMTASAGSVSTMAAKEFEQEYLKHNARDVIITLNVNEEEVGSKSLTSINNGGSNPGGDFFSDGLSDKYIDLLKNVDKVVCVAAMTNFTYPATLKNFLDHVLVANKTFKYKYDGSGKSEGLLPHLKVQLILSQGASLGWYAFGGFETLLTGTWNFMGAQVTKPIMLDGTKAPENINKTSQEKVNAKMTEILTRAREF